MSAVNVIIDDPRPIGATTIQFPFVAAGSWGRSLSGLHTGTLGNSLGAIVAALKDSIIAWAATAGGGSVTITRKDIWISGLNDDQISGVRTSSDNATSSGSFVDVPELNFTLAASAHYKFRFKGAYTTAVNTTGLQLSVNGPASPTIMRAAGVIYTSTTAPFVGVIAAYDAPIAATASAGAIALMFEVEGTISTGIAGGVLTLRGRSEVAGSAVTILRGSFGELVSVG